MANLAQLIQKVLLGALDPLRACRLGFEKRFVSFDCHQSYGGNSETSSPSATPQRSRALLQVPRVCPRVCSTSCKSVCARVDKKVLDRNASACNVFHSAMAPEGLENLHLKICIADQQKILFPKISAVPGGHQGRGSEAVCDNVLAVDPDACGTARRPEPQQGYYGIQFRPVNCLLVAW